MSATIPKLHCKFCYQSCYQPLPAETPQGIRNDLERHASGCDDCRPLLAEGLPLATCKEGQTYDRFHFGYAWRDVTQALSLLKLAQAVQQYRDGHGAACNCPTCTFAESALWNAVEKGVLDAAEQTPV